MIASRNSIIFTFLPSQISSSKTLEAKTQFATHISYITTKKTFCFCSTSTVQSHEFNTTETNNMDESWEAKANDILDTWHTSEHFLQQRKKSQYFTKFKEPPGPLALVINLGHVPVESTTATLQSSPEEAKTNQGVRTTFFISKIVYPGWSSVSSAQAQDSKDLHKRGRDSGKDNAASNEPKEKLSYMFNTDHVVLHSFSLVNMRGTYTRGGKSSECLVLSPGMVITCRTWGNKFLSVFKDQTEDFFPYDIALVQFGVHSVTSSAKNNGMMLEIKSFTKACGRAHGGLSSSYILGATSIPKSIQEATLMRNKFVDASHIPQEDTDEKLPEDVNQEMIKNNLSATSYLLRCKPFTWNGSFAIGPDDVLRFYIRDPISDLPDSVTSIKIYFHMDDFIFGGVRCKGLSWNDLRDWITKLFNMTTAAGALEMIIALDTYTSKKQKEEQNTDELEAYVRIDVSLLISKLKKPSCSGADLQYVAAVFSDSEKAKKTLANLVVFSVEDNSDISFAIDTRVITHEKPEDGVEATSISTALVHPLSGWQKSHAVYVFFEQRLVHYFVLAVQSNGGSGSHANGIRGALETISVASCMSHLMDLGDSNDELPPPSAVSEIQQKAKKKKAAAAEAST